MDRPFDDLTVAANCKGLAASDDRERRQVDGRRQRQIHRYFCFASLAALLEGREIHEWELDRPLELVNIVANEKYDGVRGIDAFDRLTRSVRLRIDEKPEHV